MKYYAVLDTNVLVSAMLKFNSVPGTVVELALDGNIIPVFNDLILDEYREVLSRKKFHLTEQIINSLLQTLTERGLNISAPSIDISNFPDPDDIVFYEVVMEKRKTENAYLITGNIKHFPVEPFVITPREMLEVIEKNENEHSRTELEEYDEWDKK